MAAQVDLARKLAAEVLGEDIILAIDPLLTSKQNEVVGLDETDTPAVEALQQLADAPIASSLSKHVESSFSRSGARAVFAKLQNGANAPFGQRPPLCVRQLANVGVTILASTPLLPC